MENERFEQLCKKYSVDYVAMHGEPTVYATIPCEHEEFMSKIENCDNDFKELFNNPIEGNKRTAEIKYNRTLADWEKP